MGEITLLSTFYSFEPFVPAAHTFSPTRIILFVDKDITKIKNHLDKVRDLYSRVSSIDIVKVDGSNLIEIATKTIEKLEDSPNPVIINISGGWKLLAQGVLYGCYARPELVLKIVCNKIEDNTLVELPKLSFGLSSAKKELLVEISKRDGESIASIATKLGKTRGMLYQHLKELKDSGYVDSSFRITEAGRLGVL